MSLINYHKLDGEIPRWSADLLPNNHAQLAKNCSFSNGKLGPMKGGALLQTMSTNPVKGIYTENGLLFYTWTTETIAFKSPIIDDSHARVYYLTPSEGIFRVTTTAGMGATGGAPASSFHVGLPRPTVAPALRTVDRTTLPEFPGAALNGTIWWDYNGAKYSEGVLVLTPVTAFREYTFSLPLLPASPPEDVVPVLTIKLNIVDTNNSNAVLAEFTVRDGSSARSGSLPGGVEAHFTSVEGVSGTVRLQWGVTEARAYTYTYENTWGEESSPAPPATISPTYLQDVQVTVTPGTFTNYRPFSQYNIYRTYGTNATYVKTTVTGGPTIFVDASRRPSSVGVAMTSTDYYPPVTGLEGICVMPGGWVAAFKDNMLYKSAPYRPHAFPFSEVFATDIRGICPGAMGLVVTTADGVYLVSGLKPSQAGATKLDAPQAGLSQRSMTGLNGAVCYASRDGLALVAGSMATMDASEKLFTRQAWMERYSDIILDNSLRLAFHDGQLVMSSSTTGKNGFVLRLDENAGTFVQHDIRMDSMFQLPVADALYYSVGANVYQFQAGDNLTYDWWSKDFVWPFDRSLGAGKIKVTGTVRLRIYADGVLWHTIDNITTGFFRVPPIRAMKWSVRFDGTGTVSEFQLAQSMGQLKNV